MVGCGHTGILRYVSAYFYALHLGFAVFYVPLRRQYPHFDCVQLTLLALPSPNAHPYYSLAGECYQHPYVHVHASRWRIRHLCDLVKAKVIYQNIITLIM